MRSLPLAASLHGRPRARRSLPSRTPARRPGFTLIELLVCIAIIALLLSILMPALSTSLRRGRATKCLAQLRVLGQGLVMYTADHDGVLVPGRLPRVNDTQWFANIAGGVKYRPTFLAMMGSNINIAPFDDPISNRTRSDRFGEKGEQQNYSSPIFVCPAVPEWTDERNGSYGYNYQFLGNSRLADAADIFSFKNWPVLVTRIHDASRTVAVADCMGTAASYPSAQRRGYLNNGRDADRMGNEGFNLDPPRVDPSNGEMAGLEEGKRTSVDPRHDGRSAVLWLDGHGDAQSPTSLGYKFTAEGIATYEGDNTLWSGTGRDAAWHNGDPN